MRLKQFEHRGYLPHFVVAFALGLLAGYKIIPANVVAIIYLCIVVYAVLRVIQGNVSAFFSIIPYAIFGEIFMRAFAKWVPYLTLQYTFILCFLILIIRTGMRHCHFKGFVFLLLFTVFEVINNMFPYKVDVSRAILTNSLALLMPVIWAAYNPISPAVINRFMNNIKIACIFLVGVVFVAHISGNIQYEGYSSSEASNGLAPVQISGYIGVACVFFFLGIMNEEKTRQRWVGIIALVTSASAMVLTFSRGGIYFVGIVVMMYLYFNRTKVRSFILFMLLVPSLMLAYYFVVEQTQGKIIDRYKQEGASNREVLVELGFVLFQRDPWIGVGTGNFNSVIYREKMYPEESGAHNEFVRAAAEHGIWGIIFYWGFFVALFFHIYQRRQPQKQYAMYFFVLFCLISVHNGLKISIQPFLLMLAAGTPSLLQQQAKHVLHPYLRKRVTA
jgi:O-antigen ligase